MWILDCEGSSLQGRRIWLRPGKKYLFGRTQPQTGKYVSGFAIRHKTVSRKHLTLAVAAVNPGDGSRLATKLKLSLKDEETKFGTKVDGTALGADAHELAGDEHTFTLGSCEDRFRVKWQPVVLSFTFPSKEVKDGKDPLVPIRSRLEDLGIKMVLPYVESTTHAVASKRNTAMGLQALVNGRYVVDNTFLDAIEYAATQTNLDEPESVSPLEEDFDRHWPDALKHVPSPGKTPQPRPPDVFAPDQRRQSLFNGFAFVFCEKRQLESLEAPIANGGGKAVLCSVNPPYTTASDLARFVSNASEGGKLTSILVKFNAEKGHQNWASKLQLDVQQRLQREVIEQNEFLDAILTCNARALVRNRSSEAAEEADEVPPLPQEASTAAKQPGASEPADPPKKARLRGTVRSAFKGFDDGFDMSQIQPHRESSANPEGSANTRKRTRSPSGGRELADDEFLPGAAAMKKRRLLENQDSSAAAMSQAQLEFENAGSADLKSPKKELDIQQAVRDRRAAEEEAARRNEEALHQTLSDMSFEEMNQLAKVEDISVREPSAPASRAERASERWDPRWNGRKNYKRFRRAGEDASGARRAQTVIVPLEEVKKKSRGVGEHYWLESGSSRRRHGGERESTVAATDEAPPTPSHLTFASAASHQEEPVPSELLDGQEAAVVDVDEPRATRHGGVAPGLKRQASSTAGKAGPGKKQRTFAVREESESEDEMKFRFRRKK